MRSRLGDGFYMNYFQAPGVADADLSRDPRATIRMLLYSASGDAPPPLAGAGQPVVPAGGGFLDLMVDPGVLPPWLTEADIDFFIDASSATGGALG